MKALKKLTALVLAVAMLIGMPLSIDVSAVKSSSEPTTFELLRAVPYVADPRYANTTGVEAKYMMMYFNGKIGNTYDRNADGGTLWTAGDMLIVDRDGKLLKTEKDSTKEAVLSGWMDASAMPQGVTVNPFRWQLSGNQVIDDLTLTDFRVVKQLLERDYYKSKGAKLVVRIVEQGTNADKNNGFVDSYFSGSDKNLKLKATNRISWGGEQVDAVLKEVSWEQVTFTAAQAISDNQIRLYFSEAIRQNAEKNNLFIGVRIVDPTDNYALKYEGSTPLQWGYGNWAYRGNELVATGNEPLSKIFAKCAAINEAEGTDKYQVMFCIEEKGDKLSDKHGEYVGNGFVDCLWGASGTAVAGSTMPKQNFYDGTYCKVTPVSELMANNVTIESVTTIERENQADRVVVTFSEAIQGISVGTYVRVFDKTNALVQYNPTTLKVEAGATGYLQWAVLNWEKADADGKVWIGTINPNLSNKTIDRIRAFCATVTDAEGKAVTEANGYKLQMAFLDQNTGKIDMNGLVDNIKSVDGTKKLYAANVQSAGEERAVCNFTESVQITSVDIYSDTYAIFTFSEDIDMTTALATLNSGTPAVWITAQADMINGWSAEPVKDVNGSHMHHRLTNARQYGNAGNKIIMDGCNLAALKARVEAAAEAGRASDICFRIEGGSPSQYVPGITSADGERYMYRSNPAASWGGRHWVDANIDPRVYVVTVEPNAVDNSLTVEFSEPVKYNAQQVTLKKNPGPGTYTAYRTQVALQRFKTADMTLDMDALYQINATSWKALDENKQETSAEYAKYWVFYFPEGAVETAINYYSSANTAYTDAIGYGFGLFEATSGMMEDPAYGLPLTGWMEDFASAPDAKGTVKYLKATSTSSGQRFFAAARPAVDMLPVEVNEAKMIDAKTIQITFSEPVRIAGGWNSIRVTYQNNLVDDSKPEFQLGGTTTAVSPDADGYASVWKFVASEEIAKFAQRQYFNNDYSKTAGYSLCMSFQEAGGVVDGATCTVTAKTGASLKASQYYRGAEGTYIDITNDPMLTVDTIITDIDLVGDVDAIISMTPIQSYGGTKSWRIIDGATGQTKVINGTKAQWNVYQWSNYLNGNTKMVASDMHEVLGADTFSEIRALMDSDDKLVFAFSDARPNGVIDGFYLTSAHGYKMQKASYTDANEDVAFVEVDMNSTAQALSLTDVSMYERVTQSYPYQDEYFLFTFSHDVADSTLTAIRDGSVAVWISVKVVGENTFWYSNDGGQTYIKTGNAAWGTRITATNFNRYGNTQNKLLAAVGGAALNDIKVKVDAINAKYGETVAELSVRFECGALSGLAGVNSKMVAKDSSVYPMILDNAWNNGGRTYYSCLSEGEAIYIGSITLTGKTTAEVTFVDASGNPIIVTNKYYNPGASVWTGLRLTKNGQLAWSYKAQVYADNAKPNADTPLQFGASLVTKNGTAADSTWILSCAELSNLLQAMGDENGYLRKNGLDLALGLEGGNHTTGGEIQDYLDAMTSLDGRAILAMTKGTANNQHFRYFFSYLNNPTKWVTGNYVPETIKVVKTEVLNNGVLQVTFDQPTNVSTSGWTGVRIVDGVNNLIRFDTTTKQPLGNIMNVGEKDGNGLTTGLAQANVQIVKADTEGKVWNFCTNGGFMGTFGFADMLEMIENAPATGNWVGGLKLAIIVEGGTHSLNGLTDRVTAADGSGAKLANDQMGNWIGEGSTFVITKDMLSKMDVDNRLTIESVKQVSKKQLLVTFSEAVEIASNPFMGIRYVDENNMLIYSNRDAAGVTVRGDYGKGTAMQWPSAKWEWNDDTHTSLLVSFYTEIGAILDGSNLPASLSPTSNPEYSYKFVLEETKPNEADVNDWAFNGMVADVSAVANPDKLLTGNYDHKGTSWDGTAVEITNVLTPDALITVSDGKITGENQITFEWSHAINLSNPSSYYAAFRYVNENGLLYKNPNQSFGDGWIQLGAFLNYADAAQVKMTAHISPNNYGITDFAGLLNPTDPALKAFVDANPGHWVLCIEEKSNGGNGTIDTFFGKDGHVVLADPFMGNWNDAVQIDITGTPITGSLSVTKMEVISDTDVKVSFSAPIVFAKNESTGKDSVPFVSMRLYNSSNKLLFWNPVTEQYTTNEAMYDADGKRVYKNQNGYTTEKEGYNASGEWVPYAAQKNTPMQWSSSWKWADDKHTAIIYTLSGGALLPVKNITDILNYDFTKFIEGSYVGFDIEENTPAMIDSNCHVDNILRADNAKIALDANFFPHNRDSVMTRLEDLTISYTPRKIVSETKIINDTQIRVSFTEPMEIKYAPFMAIRMIDKDGNLMWNAEPNKSTPYQWSGKWEWEDESHTAIIWTMTTQLLGGKTIYDLANWVGALGKYKDEGTWMFVIEELDKTAQGYAVGRHNRLVDNVVSKDGTNHLYSTYSNGYDGILTALNVEDLVGPEVELKSAVAIDDQTIELTFTEAVTMSEDISVGVRYLSPSGDSEVLTDGKVAYFKGDWEYKDDTKKVITWKLNSKNADNLTDIINYNGKFEWNKGARVAFVIMDAEDQRATTSQMRINGVYDLKNGFRTLKANYATKDYPMTQMDITIGYDLPAPEAEGGTGNVEQIQYVTNYVPFIVASGVIVLAGLVVAIILFKKRKSAH